MTQGTVLGVRELLAEFHLIDHRQRDVKPDPIDGEENQRDEDLLAQLGDLEDRDDLVHNPLRGSSVLGEPSGVSRRVPNNGQIDPSISLPIHFTSFGGRGFILLRTGFFGGGTRSMPPPAFSIFSFADLEKWSARTVSFLVSSPSPRMRTPS